ncbi:hypothetical protein D3C72_2189420 [compost metagenome]
MFSMLFATSGCSTPPQNLDLSLDKSTEGGRYRIAVIKPTPAPAVNQLHNWKVKLATPGGKPVTGAQFAVGGGMPQHGHGYPTQPRVTRELEDTSRRHEVQHERLVGAQARHPGGARS